MTVERCKSNVYHPGMWRPSQCQRKATIDGYCKQHHPETAAAKDRERKAKYDAEWAAKTAATQAKQAKIARLIELSCEEARQIIDELNLR